MGKTLIVDTADLDSIKKGYSQIESWLKIRGQITMSFDFANRTLKLNAALHVLFNEIAIILNEAGIPCNLDSIIDGYSIEVRWTGLLVKEKIWRNMQIVKYGKTSTTKLTTIEINEIYDELCLFFGERGYQLNFPSKANHKTLFE